MSTTTNPTTTVAMSELLNVAGFADRLIIVRDEHDDDARTVQINDILPADPRVSPVGTFDLLCLDAHDLVVVLEGLYVHQIEDMLVSECSSGCEDCAPFRTTGGES